jgi:hypothetical protein
MHDNDMETSAETSDSNSPTADKIIGHTVDRIYINTDIKTLFAIPTTNS